MCTGVSKLKKCEISKIQACLMRFCWQSAKLGFGLNMGWVGVGWVGLQAEIKEINQINRIRGCLC